MLLGYKQYKCGVCWSQTATGRQYALCQFRDKWLRDQQSWTGYMQFKIVIQRLCSSRLSHNSEGCHCKIDLATAAQHHPSCLWFCCCGCYKHRRRAYRYSSILRVPATAGGETSTIYAQVRQRYKVYTSRELLYVHICACVYQLRPKPGRGGGPLMASYCATARCCNPGAPSSAV